MHEPHVGPSPRLAVAADGSPAGPGVDAQRREHRVHPDLVAEHRRRLGERPYRRAQPGERGGDDAGDTGRDPFEHVGGDVEAA